MSDIDANLLNAVTHAVQCRMYPNGFGDCSFEQEEDLYGECEDIAKAAIAAMPHLWDTPCPYVYTSKGGTSHCTLAARDTSAEKTRVESVIDYCEEVIKYADCSSYENGKCAVSYNVLDLLRGVSE